MALHVLTRLPMRLLGLLLLFAFAAPDLADAHRGASTRTKQARQSRPDTGMKRATKTLAVKSRRWSWKHSEADAGDFLTPSQKANRVKRLNAFYDLAIDVAGGFDHIGTSSDRRKRVDLVVHRATIGFGEKTIRFPDRVADAWVQDGALIVTTTRLNGSQPDVLVVTGIEAMAFVKSAKYPGQHDLTAVEVPLEPIKAALAAHPRTYGWQGSNPTTPPLSRAAVRAALRAW
jgi:hypothetical protein